MRFVIEHLDQDLYDWCLCEYRHISEVVGKKNLLFTLGKIFHDSDKIWKKEQRYKLKQLGEVSDDSVTSMDMKRVCVLDPYAKKILVPQDAAKFDFFVFGGILGDSPPQQRTKPLLSDRMKCETRNLGQKQLPTDQAVLVAHMILVEKTPFEKIKFIEELVIPAGEGEEIILPFRFVTTNGKPALARGYIKMVIRNGF